MLNSLIVLKSFFMIIRYSTEVGLCNCSIPEIKINNFCCCGKKLGCIPNPVTCSRGTSPFWFVFGKSRKIKYLGSVISVKSEM